MTTLTVTIEREREPYQTEIGYRITVQHEDGTRSELGGQPTWDDACRNAGEIVRLQFLADRPRLG